MNLDQLPINLFDLVVIVVLAAGIARGRKHGMSEELLSLLKWLAILFGCAAVYEPGGQMIGQFTSMFSRLTCYLLAYVGGACWCCLCLRASSAPWAANWWAATFLDGRSIIWAWGRAWCGLAACCWRRWRC